MNTRAHTPGPWVDSPGSGDAIISTNHDAIQAEIDRGGPFTKEALEDYGGYVIAESVAPNNKALIKAAPEMLTACKSMRAAINAYRDTDISTMAFFGLLCEGETLVNAAIAKVEGE